MDALPARAPLFDRADPARLIQLSRELRLACAEYRSMALYAGPLHRLTLEAKERVDQITAVLRAEIEQPRSGAAIAPA